MAPKKTRSVEVPDPEQPSTDVSEKGAKNSEKLKLDVAGESSEVAVPRKASTHPSTMEMVKEAVKALDTRKGPSAQAIRGYILEKYPSVDAIRLKYMLRRALTKGLEVGTLVRPANSTGNGAQGRFRLAVQGKTKEPKKGTENSDPNKMKPKVETKSKGTGSKKTKPVPKKLKDEDSGSTKALTSKVAPAKKPKAAAKEGAKAVAKTKTATVPKARKAKSPAKHLEGGEAAAKKPGKRGKNAQ